MTDDNKSAFLTRLPTEIRCHIYKLIFGEKIIAIIPAGGEKLRHCVCPARGQKYHDLAWKPRDTSSYCQCYTHQATGEKRLPLLLTCRQIYSEAVDVLWSHSPLYLKVDGGWNCRLLADIKEALSPRVFDAIRMLEISFLHGAYNDPVETLDEKWFTQWAGFWDVVRSMKGLVRIQAWIKMDQEQGGNMMAPDQEARLFAPFLQLDWLRDFDVEVTWGANEDSENLLRDAPFRLTRNDEPTPGKPEAVETEID